MVWHGYFGSSLVVLGWGQLCLHSWLALVRGDYSKRDCSAALMGGRCSVVQMLRVPGGTLGALKLAASSAASV